MTTTTGPGRGSLPAWSVSQTETFSECRLRWYLRHVLHLDPAHPASAQAVLGSALHDGLAAAFQAIPSRPTRRAAMLHDVGSVALTALDDYLDMHATHPRRVAHREDARRLLQDVLASIPTPAQDSVLGVEHPFTLHHVGVSITGRIDLVMRTGRAGIHIRDWKLGDVPHAKEALEHNTQLCVYTAAARHLWPWAEVVSVGLYSISQRREITTVLSPESVTYALDCLAWDYETARGMRAEKPNPTGGPHCGTCEFRAYCPNTRAGTYPVLPGVDVAAGIDAVNNLNITQ